MLNRFMPFVIPSFTNLFFDNRVFECMVDPIEQRCSPYNFILLRKDQMFASCSTVGQILLHEGAKSSFKCYAFIFSFHRSFWPS